MIRGCPNTYGKQELSEDNEVHCILLRCLSLTFGCLSLKDSFLRLKVLCKTVADGILIFYYVSEQIKLGI